MSTIETTQNVLEQTVNLAPYLQGVVEFGETARDTMDPLGEAVVSDYRNASILGRLTVLSALAGQAVDRTYVATVAIAANAVQVLAENPHSPVKAGLAVGIPVFLSQWAISGTLAEAMNISGKTVKTVNNMFPGAVDAARDYAPPDKRTPLSYARESLSGFAVGATSFVLAEKTAKPETSKSKMRLTAARVSALGGVAGAGVGVGVQRATEVLSDNQVQWLMDKLDKNWTYLAAAMLWEAPRFIKRRIQRRRIEKLSNTDQALDQENVTTIVETQ